LEIRDTKVGAQLALTVEFEGRELLNQHEEMKQPLKENGAFFLQMEFNDLELRSYAGGRSGVKVRAINP
jgi:hypothetical protein